VNRWDFVAAALTTALALVRFAVLLFPRRELRRLPGVCGGAALHPLAFYLVRLPSTACCGPISGSPGGVMPRFHAPLTRAVRNG